MRSKGVVGHAISIQTVYKGFSDVILFEEGELYSCTIDVVTKKGRRLIYVYDRFQRCHIFYSKNQFSESFIFTPLVKARDILIENILSE